MSKTEITDELIRAQRKAAAAAGNGPLVNLCDLALDGNASARTAVAALVRIEKEH